jgi:hypothetical protein
MTTVPSWYTVSVAGLSSIAEDWADATCTPRMQARVIVHTVNTASFLSSEALTP